MIKNRNKGQLFSENAAVTSSKSKPNAEVKATSVSTPVPRFPNKTSPAKASSYQKMKMEQDSRRGERLEVMELPARLVPGTNKSVHQLNGSVDRIRNGGSGDSCMRIPLECLSKDEIKDEMKTATLHFLHGGIKDDDDEQESWPHEKLEEQEEVYNEEMMTTILGPDRARFNIWKGTNYDLHLLGDFKNDFERTVKSFQRPQTERILMDPFCRAESGLKDEMYQGEAFLVWKNTKNADMWQQQSSSSSAHDICTSTLIGSDSDIGEDDTSENAENSDVEESEADLEIKEYIRGLKDARRDGRSCTGETLYYDEEFGVVRNLHTESHSLTNYGTMPDDTWIGKASVFYPEMTAKEKQMLKAVVSRTDINQKT